jgi:hypothetical protein
VPNVGQAEQDTRVRRRLSSRGKVGQNARAGVFFKGLAVPGRPAPPARPRGCRRAAGGNFGRREARR